ncbi:MAG: transporter substrate-binding domain-containing protein [Thaumarchaeota archaeon]|nr:transporter substrate-binding domain-containing protein [Nitrososphaerota archaeon]
MKSVPQTLFVISVIIAVVIAFSAGFYTKSSLGSPADTLVVGTSTPFPPFEFKNEAGEVVGFDIDLAREVANALGLDLEIRDLSGPVIGFDALIPTLGSGGVDMIAAGMSINSERTEYVDFSIPYYDANQGILVRRDSLFSCPSSVCEAEHLEGVKIIIQIGTTSQSWVESNLPGIITDPNRRLATDEIIQVSDLDLIIKLLLEGEADVAILDEPAAEGFAKQDIANLRVAGRLITDEQYALVVQKGDPQNLLPTINEVITELMRSGRYDELIAKWFQ